MKKPFSLNTKSKLKLLALDKDDLDVISTCLQDAVLSKEQITVLPDSVIMNLCRLNLFDLQINKPATSNKTTAGNDHHIAPEFPARYASKLTIGYTKKVYAKNLDAGATIVLLAIKYEQKKDDELTGELIFYFAGKGRLRIEVECLELTLTDLGPAWQTGHIPKHKP